jgi:hypothetical protein
MKETSGSAGLRQAIGWKAAWFSLLAPLGSLLIVFVSFSLLFHFGPDDSQHIAQLILGSALIIQTIGLIMGIAGGLIATSGLAKGISVIGLLLSVALGFVTVALLSITIWGMGGG